MQVSTDRWSQSRKDDMLVSALIVSFILGIVVTLLVQYVFISRRLLGQPTLEVVNRPQTEKFKLPKVITIFTIVSEYIVRNLFSLQLYIYQISKYSQI